MINMISLFKILKISGIEFKKYRTKSEKKIILVLFILGILVYSSVSLFMELGIYGTEKYYTFYSDDEIISSVLHDTGKFLKLDNVDADLYIDRTDDGIFIYPQNTERALAAISEFETAIKEYNNKLFSVYDAKFAYPLRVKIIEIERDVDTIGESSTSVISNEIVYEETENFEIYSENESDSSNISNYSKINISDENNENQINNDITIENNFQNINVNNHGDDFEDTNLLNESVISSNDDFFDEIENTVHEDSYIDEYLFAQEINPFSQFSILLIIVIMTMPLSMLALVFSNSIMAEKINKRGIFLLLAPISKLEIILGKSLPYLVLSLLGFLPIILSNTIMFIEVLYSLIIILTVILAYLSIGFFSAMISRSHKELSFLGIFMISIYSCYLLIPTFMLNFSVISLASPLSIIAKLFRNEYISLNLLLFTVIPTLISSLGIFFLGSTLLNDQDMFSYKSISAKIKSSILKIVSANHFNIFLLSFFSIPIIFLIQLMMIVIVLSVQSMASIFIMIFFAATIEELFRNFGIYVLMNKNKKKIAYKKLFLYSFLAGFGFFIGEKALLLIMIAPFIDAYNAIALSGLILPFIFHILLSFIFSVAYKLTKNNSYIISMVLVSLLHFLINISIAFIGGGFQ